MASEQGLAGGLAPGARRTAPLAAATLSFGPLKARGEAIVHHLALAAASACLSAHISAGRLDADALFGAASALVLGAWGWVEIGRRRSAEEAGRRASA